MFTFRYNLLTSFLSKPDHHHPSYDFLRYFFRKYRKLGVDRELFATKLDPKFFCHLPTFHSELLHAWDIKIIGARFATLPTDYDFCINLPITSYLFPRVDRDDSTAASSGDWRRVGSDSSGICWTTKVALGFLRNISNLRPLSDYPPGVSPKLSKTSKPLCSL